MSTEKLSISSWAFSNAFDAIRTKVPSDSRTCSYESESAASCWINTSRLRSRYLCKRSRYVKSTVSPNFNPLASRIGSAQSPWSNPRRSLGFHHA